MLNHTKLPKGSIRVTVNVASQIRIYPLLTVIETYGFRPHGKAEFHIITREGVRIGVLEYLENNDSRNGPKKERGCYKIQHERNWTDCTIVVGKYAKENLAKISKGDVESWSPRMGCLEFMLPHRFRKEKGVFTDLEKQTMTTKTKATSNKKKSEDNNTYFDLREVNRYIRDFKDFNKIEQKAIQRYFADLDEPA